MTAEAFSVLSRRSFVSVRWRMTNFSSTLTVGSYLQSNEFSLAMEKTSSSDNWCIVCYPMGDGPTNEGFVGVYVRNLSGYRQRSFHEVSLDGTSHRSFTALQDHDPGSDVGFPRFISRRSLIEGSLLESGALTITCKVHVLQAEENQLDILKLVEMCRISNSFHQFMKDEKTTDFSILVDKEVFRVHSSIISASSEVFQALLSHKMIESEKKELQIKDFEEGVVEQLITFMYTGAAPKLEIMSEELYAAADKYDLEGLKTMCYLHMISTIAFENVCKRLSWGEIYNNFTLKCVCLDFIKKNMMNVIQTEGFMELMASHPALVREAIEHSIKTN